ncbi:MAG: hypothetical protein KJ799_09845 [Bacteroidetes bacterium]|nr:hypothetical protein [Bacteroidota bacterium]
MPYGPTSNKLLEVDVLSLKLISHNQYQIHTMLVGVNPDSPDKPASRELTWLAGWDVSAFGKKFIPNELFGFNLLLSSVIFLFISLL